MQLEELFDTNFKYLDEFKEHVSEISTINKVVEFINVKSYLFDYVGNALVLYDLITDMPNLVVFKTPPLSLKDRIKSDMRKRIKTPGYVLTETRLEGGEMLLAYVKDFFI